mmetsp:Transcript_19180/g.41293  ORF Transcript_19180/g.41293 Transcript_19180/m.41293 type:complete len:84 (-) Transcript_19180:193-444(-)
MGFGHLIGVVAERQPTECLFNLVIARFLRQAEHVMERLVSPADTLASGVHVICWLATVASPYATIVPTLAEARHFGGDLSRAR